MPNRKRVLETIGWREWVDLPELGIHCIKAKVDTGARSSALHAFDIETLENGNQTMVRFKVHPIQRDAHTVVVCEAPLVDWRKVRSSTGRAMIRPAIRSQVRVGSRVIKTEITLVRRDLMGFRMLLGRRALKQKFLVDCGRSFVVSKHAEERKA